jgi:hypothetical protein
MLQQTVRRALACAVLTSCVGATAATVIVATGASASDPPPRAARATTATGPEPATEPRRLRLAWVGDTMLGHAGATPPDGGDVLFDAARRTLRGADLAFGNLEGVLAEGGASKCGATPGENCFAFRGAPGSARALRRAGFDVLNLANNHAWDYGAIGQAETLAALSAHDVAHTGRPGQVTVLRRDGVRVAFVGFAPYPWAASLLDIPGAVALVKRAARQADVVVVAMHAGAEGSDQTHTPLGREHAYGEDRGETRAFAHAVVDAGADLVVGSGPHVLRGIELRRGRLIAYSLGNFAGWHNFGAGGVLSLTGVLEVTLERTGRLAAGRLRSMLIAPPGVPGPDPAHGAARLVDGVSAQDFGAAAVRLDAVGRMRLAR